MTGRLGWEAGRLGLEYSINHKGRSSEQLRPNTVDAIDDRQVGQLDTGNWKLETENWVLTKIELDFSRILAFPN